MRKLYLPILLIGLVWHTQVMGQNIAELDDITERKLFQLKGSISLGSNFYFTSADRRQQNPFGYILNASPIFSVYGYDVPLSLTFANENFSLAGPNTNIFDRLGASPYYKWIKVHAGYRNVQYSPYTLNNHNFLGGGVELTPGKWKIGFVYGRFQQAREADTVATSQNQQLSYKRTGYAGKVGYGDDQNYVELSFLKAADDPNSITRPSGSDLNPAENLVFGLSARKSLWPNLYAELNFGASAYTDNIASETVQLSSGALRLFTPFYQPRVSSRLNFAGDVRLTYTQSSYSLAFEYKRIEPNYRTMGSYFFNNDLERYSLQPSATFLNGRLSASGSFGYQRNNLLENKVNTTRRIISSLNIQYSPLDRLTINGQYSNYSTNQSASLIRANDTVRIYQVTHNVNISPSYYISSKNHTQSFVLSLSNQTLVDRSNYVDPSRSSESETYNANLNYRFQQRPSDYSLKGGLNYIILNNQNQDITQYGFTAGAEKGLWEGDFNAGFSSSFNLSNRNGSQNGYIINNNLNARYKPWEKHTFMVAAQIILNRTSFDYEDYMINLNYSYTF